MASASMRSHLFIGLMSGTSLDGVDGVLASFPDDAAPTAMATLASAYLPFSAELKQQLLALQSVDNDELHRAALAAEQLVRLYADCVSALLKQAGLATNAICAIGVHGQTLRHRPELGYTWQLNQPALLAELSGIDVIADFRSRDLAAGGQGAPLVPAFHHALFGHNDQRRVVANIGGISNISVLSGGDSGAMIGFDTGPGNILMDSWIAAKRGQPYDAAGAWAASGKPIESLLATLCANDFFALPAPKSTGRDLFNLDWLRQHLTKFPDAADADVQATLAVFTAQTLAQAIARYARDAEGIYICGGGAHNPHLLACLRAALDAADCHAALHTTDHLGVPPQHVEALAFAWLAHRFTLRLPGNLPAVTGARGLRILGALYPTG